MWNAISEGVLKGMGVAGLIIGCLAVLGIFLLIVGIFCLAMYYVYGQEEEEDAEAEEPAEVPEDDDT